MQRTYLRLIISRKCSMWPQAALQICIPGASVKEAHKDASSLEFVLFRTHIVNSYEHMLKGRRALSAVLFLLLFCSNIYMAWLCGHPLAY